MNIYLKADAKMLPDGSHVLMDEDGDCVADIVYVSDEEYNGWTIEFYQRYNLTVGCMKRLLRYIAKLEKKKVND